MIERRFLKGPDLRANQDGKPAISGYASVFNEVYDSGWFRETIKPGAFARALRENQDVRALLNHDPNYLLGRTKANTLTLREDTKGLFFDCTLPDTQVGNDVRTSIQRGDLDGCSFAFQVVKQTWREEKEDPSDPKSRMIQYRDLEDLDLYDVSAVTYPAYEGTSVGARAAARTALWPEGIPAEIRSHVPGLESLNITEVRGMEDTPNNEGDGGGDDNEDTEVCSCRCEACSGCTQRSKLAVAEERQESGLPIDVAKARARMAEMSLSSS